MMVITILISSVVSGVLYRLGGIGRPFRTWMRDWTIPAVVIGVMLYLGIQAVWWAWVLSYILIGAALTTYLDRVFGYDNFYAHGFLIALGLLPIVLAGSLEWLPFLIRAIVLGLSMGWWCRKFSNDIVEEVGRGGLIIFTLFLFIFFSSF